MFSTSDVTCSSHHQLIYFKMFSWPLFVCLWCSQKLVKSFQQKYSEEYIVSVSFEIFGSLKNHHHVRADIHGWLWFTISHYHQPRIMSVFLSWLCCWTKPSRYLFLCLPLFFCHQVCHLSLSTVFKVISTHSMPNKSVLTTSNCFYRFAALIAFQSTALLIFQSEGIRNSP